jgi:hypothetical protein
MIHRLCICHGEAAQADTLRKASTENVNDRITTVNRVGGSVRPTMTCDSLGLLFGCVDMLLLDDGVQIALTPLPGLTITGSSW